MREGAKQRLLGAVVIVALAVIFVPMLFEDAPPDSAEPDQLELAVPEAPPFEPDLKGEVFLGPEDSGVGGLEGVGGTESRPLSLPPAGDLDPASAAEVSEEGLDDNVAGVTREPGAPSVASPVSRSSTSTVLEPTPPRGPRDGMPSWVVQVASLGSPEAAQAMQDKLRKAGYSAFVEQAEVRGKLFYRVRVGPEVDRANAERTAARLRQQQKLDTLIQNYP